MTKMLVPNPIFNFAKMNHRYFCGVALETGDVGNFLRHLFCHMADRDGRVDFETPATAAISRLTGWQKETIKKALQRLSRAGEIMRPKEDDCVIIWNDWVVNRQGVIMPKQMPYEGPGVQHTKRQTEMLEKLDNMVVRRSNTMTMIDVIEENEKLKDEVMQLKIELSHAKGHGQGYEKGVGRVLDNVFPKPEEQKPAPSLELVKKEAVTPTPPTPISAAKRPTV